MEELKEKSVVFSRQYASDTEEIYNYGVETFGEVQANIYENFIDRTTNELFHSYLMYPECRWLPTKGRIYRNIILESHLIIYRIKAERVEVLRVLHSKSSISRIRTTRKIKI